MSRLRWLLLVLSAALLIVPLSAPLAQVSDKAYIIGPEDVLEIQVWERKDLNQTVFVRPDGRTSLPLVGEIMVAGKTVQELQDHLATVYDKTSQNAVVTVIVKEIKSRPVYFVGGFGRPGPMQLTRELTLMQAISLVGGVVPGGDAENGYVLRGDKRIAVDFYKLLQKGDLKPEHPARARRHGGRPGRRPGLCPGRGEGALSAQVHHRPDPAQGNHPGGRAHSPGGLAAASTCSAEELVRKRNEFAWTLIRSCGRLRRIQT